MTDQMHTLRKETIDELPGNPGVYYFYRDETPLYIGKSIDIRQRVRSHFYDRKKDSRKQRLFSSANRLEYRETVGELSALLLESREIKNLRPLYNKLLRRQKNLLTWRLEPSPELHLELYHHSWPPADNAAQLGLFRNRRQANAFMKRFCQAHQLCEKRIGPVRTKGPCFAFQLGRCRGVCAGLETEAAHDQRLQAALARELPPEWPFPGALAIKESSSSNTYLVLDRWHFIGEAINIAQARLLACKSPCKEQGTLLDYDSYKIVLSFVSKTDKLCERVQLT